MRRVAASLIDFKTVPIPTSAPAQRTLAYVLCLADPEYVQVWVCNNAYDSAPAWEITGSGQAHDFSNQTSSTGAWAIGVRVKITPSASVPFVYCDGLYVV